MAGWDHIHNLMVELGDLMDLAQISEYADQSVWHLVTEAGSIEVDYDDAGDRVLLLGFNWSSQHLSALIAAPHQELRLAFSSRASCAALH
jgi:hypothetical protein